MAKRIVKKNSAKKPCPLCTKSYKEITIGPNGEIYAFIGSLCPKHRRLWEKWEEKCSSPCYIWDNGLVNCAIKCNSPLKAFFKAQAELEGESDRENYE